MYFHQNTSYQSSNTSYQSSHINNPIGEIMQNGAGQQGILGHKFSPPAMQTPHPQRGLQPHEQLDISPSSL